MNRNQICKETDRLGAFFGHLPGVKVDKVAILGNFVTVLSRGLIPFLSFLIGSVS